MKKTKAVLNQHQHFPRQAHAPKLIRKGPTLAQELQNQSPITNQQIRNNGGELVASLEDGPVYWLPDWSLLCLLWQGAVAVMDSKGVLRKKGK